MACYQAYPSRPYHVKIIKYLLEKAEVFIDQVEDDGVTPLLIVAQRGNLELTRLFIEAYGANIHATDDVSANKQHDYK